MSDRTDNNRGDSGPNHSGPNYSSPNYSSRTESNRDESNQSKTRRFVSSQSDSSRTESSKTNFRQPESSKTNFSRSKIIRCKNYTWPDVTCRKYKETGAGFRDICRYVLLGEQEDEQELNFQTRYFEIGKDGYSSLERHRHPHTVIIIKGSGSMILGNEIRDLKPVDTVYIAPDTVHQFHADNGEPLGFICIVDRYRDRPPETPRTQQELKSWIPDAGVRKKARI